jgi:hypothetical protein
MQYNVDRWSGCMQLWQSARIIAQDTVVTEAEGRRYKKKKKKKGKPSIWVFSCAP